MRDQLYSPFPIQRAEQNVQPKLRLTTHKFVVWHFPPNKSDNNEKHFQGRVIFSSGSPFPPVNYNGKIIKPGQGNNAYIFPGVALGVIATLMHHIPDDVFLIAARELAACVRDSDLESGSLYPPLDSVREVSLRIAVGITKYAYAKGEYIP